MSRPERMRRVDEAMKQVALRGDPDAQGPADRVRHRHRGRDDERPRPREGLGQRLRLREAARADARGARRAGGRAPGEDQPRAQAAPDPASRVRLRSRGRARRAHDAADRRARAAATETTMQPSDTSAVVEALRAARPLRRHLAREPGRRRARVAARDAPRARGARQGLGDGARRRAAAPGRVRLPRARGARAAARGARGRRPSACSSRSTARRRAASSSPALSRRAPLTVNIDHHHDNTRFGDVDLVVEDASSTGEVLADVFAALGVELTPAIAEALYTAVVTDTGRFQYSNTTPKALRLAAELVEAGADVNKVFVEVYESTPFPKLKLLARALDRATELADGRVVVSELAPRGLRGGRGGGALLGGDHRPPARGRRHRARGARPRAPGRRGVGAQGLAPLASGRRRRLRDRPRASAAAATSGPPGSRPTSRWTRSRSGSSTPSCARTATSRADGDPEGARADRRHPRRQACRPVLVRDRRARPRPHGREDGARGHARPVRDRPPDPPLGPRDEPAGSLHEARQALPDGDRPHARDDDRRPGGRCRSRSTSRRRATRSSARSTACAARSSCRSRPRRR